MHRSTVRIVDNKISVSYIIMICVAYLGPSVARFASGSVKRRSFKFKVG